VGTDSAPALRARLEHLISAAAFPDSFGTHMYLTPGVSCFAGASQLLRQQLRRPLHKTASRRAAAEQCAHADQSTRACLAARAELAEERQTAGRYAEWLRQQHSGSAQLDMSQQQVYFRLADALQQRMCHGHATRAAEQFTYSLLSHEAAREPLARLAQKCLLLHLLIAATDAPVHLIRCARARVPCLHARAATRALTSSFTSCRRACGSVAEPAFCEPVLCSAPAVDAGGAHAPTVAFMVAPGLRVHDTVVRKCRVFLTTPPAAPPPAEAASDSGVREAAA
jgi:hypothetical protein